MAQVKELVEDIAKALVGAPEAVDVREVNNDYGTVVELRVAPSDVGKMIGKQGRTARSLRTLLTTAGLKSNKRITLDILE